MARLDTGWHANPKILALPVVGMALHAWSISYCDASTSDGFIPEGAWPAKLAQGVKVLRAVGMYEPVDGGYALHDYLKYNRSRAQILAIQAEDRTRKSSGKQPDSGRNPNGIHADSGRIPRAPGPGPGPGVNNAAAAAVDAGPGRARETAAAASAKFHDLPDEVRARLLQRPIHADG